MLKALVEDGALKVRMIQATAEINLGMIRKKSRRAAIVQLIRAMLK